MSTDFITEKPIKFAELFDGRLEPFGVREHVIAEASEFHRSLTDGRYYLRAYGREDGTLGCLTSYAGNAFGTIINAIANAFDTEIYSEFEPQFWGFSSDAEWKRAMNEDAQQSENEFYAEIMKYLQGQESSLRPETVGMIMAKIAKELVAQDSTLMSLDNRRKLLNEIERIYRADHVVSVRLSDRDIEFAKSLARR